MSHAAIVCREYGLPAVVGTGCATAEIRTGQTIRVDGSEGTVTCSSASSAMAAAAYSSALDSLAARIGRGSAVRASEPRRAA